MRSLNSLYKANASVCTFHISKQRISTQWRTEGGGSTPPPRISDVLTKSKRIANWAEKV